jgi:RNase P subunit RPR2
MDCPNCRCPTATEKQKSVGNDKRKGMEKRIYCRNCGWL